MTVREYIPFIKSKEFCFLWFENGKIHVQVSNMYTKKGSIKIDKSFLDKEVMDVVNEKDEYEEIWVK